MELHKDYPQQGRGNLCKIRAYRNHQESCRKGKGDSPGCFIDYLTENTCSKVISMDIDGDVVKNIEFMGGCNGNLKTIPLLLDGWTVDQIESKLSGIICGRRPTSCSDQLAKAVKEGYFASKDDGNVGIQGDERKKTW